MSSSFDETRMSLRKLLAILLKRHSIMLSHEACVGVNTKEKRFGTVNRYSLVSLEVCAEWLSSVITSFIPGGKALSKYLEIFDEFFAAVSVKDSYIEFSREQINACQ